MESIRRMIGAVRRSSKVLKAKKKEEEKSKNEIFKESHAMHVPPMECR